MSVDVFGTMLAQTIENLPKIEFNPAVSDLDTVAAIIADGVELRFESSDTTCPLRKDKIVAQCMDTYAKLQNNPNYHQYFNKLDGFAESLADKVNNVFNLLQTTVQPEVISMRDEIMQLANANNDNANLREDGVSLKLVELDKYYAPISGRDNAVREINTLLRVPQETINVPNRVVLNDIGNMIRLDALELDEETKADIIKRVTDEAKIDSSLVLATYDIITNPYAFGKMVHETIYKAANSNENYISLQNCVSYIIHYAPIVLAFRNTKFNLSDQVHELLIKNIEVAGTAFLAIGYAIAILEDSWKDAILIAPDTIVKQVTGVDEQLIKKYTFVNFIAKKLPFPSTGVSMEEIRNTEVAIRSEYDTLLKHVASKEDTERKYALYKATVSVLTNRLNETHENLLPEGMNLEEFVRVKKPLVERTANMLNTNIDNNLENVLYTFVIDAWYPNSIISAAHSLFSAEIIKHLNISPEVDDSTIAIIDVTVATKLIIRFLTNLLV